MDKLEIGIAAEGQVRVLAAITNETVAEGVLKHKTSPTASAAFGRVLTGTALLGASIKDFDRLSVRIDADGPIKGIVGESDIDGNIRGYVRNPVADSDLSADGKLDVRSIVGSGMFYVIREAGYEMGLRKDPYVGSVPIVSGEIAEDFAHYLMKSEQIPSAVLLGVLLDKEEPFVRASGGVLVQMMPGANEHLATMIEDTIMRAPHVTSAIEEGANATDLIEMAIGDIPFESLDSRELRFKCNCSQERAITMVASLGVEEVRSMLEEDKGAKIDCGFCRDEFVLKESDLESILVSLSNE